MSTWADSMPDTVTVAPVDSRRGDGAPVYGTRQEIDCMFVDGSSVVRNNEGEVVDVTSTIITHDEVGDDWGVWVDGTDTTKDAEATTPSSVTRYHDFGGSDELWEVEL